MQSLKLVESSLKELAELEDDPRLRVREILAARRRKNCSDWIEDHYYIPETPGQKMRLEPFQRAVLNYATQRDRNTGRFKFQTVVWSQPKKSGKTAIGGGVCRWAAETWGPFQLVMCMGNDAEQARERSFASVRQSIELDPRYDRRRQEIPGQWKVQSKYMQHIPSGSVIKAVATDAAGEAGANPSITMWTELWGFVHKEALKFWAEMAPSPVRPNSIRWVETYAGFEGESQLLETLYETGKKRGRQLTAGELAMGDPDLAGCFVESPKEDDLVPCWVNDRSGIFMYWDDGEVARRMPWQKGMAGDAYYANEADTQTPMQFNRFHLNLWGSGETNFVPIELWDVCENPLPLLDYQNDPASQLPMVVSLDAAVTGDCFGLLAVSRDPDDPVNKLAVRVVRKWDPPPGGSIDYGAPGGPEETVKMIISNWNVVQVAYDEYQLHDMATRLGKVTTWWRKFGQGQERLISDKQLYDLIVHRRIRHGGSPDLRQHIINCNAKHSKDEDNKLRLVKKSENRHIDLAVCLSMATAECLRLNL